MAKLVELDWSGIEAVIVGWLSRDPDYIRLAWLGVHDFLTSHAVHKPAELSWPIDDLLRYFREIKKAHPEERDQSKRMVHGTNYLETVGGIYKRFRKLFKSQREAEALQSLYYSIAPKLKPWQHATIELAARQNFLGGAPKPDAPFPYHPFSYRHEFYDIYSYRQITSSEATAYRRRGLTISEINGRQYVVTFGNDARRAVAYGPQSIAAGIIRETSLRLYDPDQPNFVGDLFHGQTPLRAIIHDSFLNEVEDRFLDRLIERSCREMQRLMSELPLPPEWGLGSHLQFGVEVKVGRDWASMEKVPVPQPWLAQLKGKPDDLAAQTLDLGDRSVVDEELDPETVDDDFAEPDVYDFGGGYGGGYDRRYGGGGGGGESSGAAADDEVPF
jgi:hypothetical protein